MTKQYEQNTRSKIQIIVGGGFMLASLLIDFLTIQQSLMAVGILALILGNIRATK